MKTKIFTFLIISLITIFYTNLFSQSKLTIQVLGGYSAPMSQLKGDIPLLFPDSSESSYQMKSGFNGGATAKLAFGKDGNFRVVAGFYVNSFSNSSSVYYATGSPSVSMKPKLTCFSPSLGVEYYYNTGSQLNPYAGIDFTSSFFSGTGYVVDSVSRLTTSPIKEVSLKSEARFGFQFGAGAEYLISKEFGLNLGFKYHFVNLTKEAEVVSGGVISELDLGDKEHTGYYGKSVSARNISYLQIYAGVSFFFGKLF